jgi:hypothetical protein
VHSCTMAASRNISQKWWGTKYWCFLQILAKHGVLNNAAQSPQDRIRATPTIDTGIDGFEHFKECREVGVVRC